MLLIPARTDTTYFHDYIYGKAEIRFVRGRLRFTDDEGNASDPAPFPSMVVTSNGVAYPVETTFAYYRLIELTHTGTIDDPIPYPETAGIVVNVENGKYYSYKGKIYLAKADMPNCVYPPDTPSLWQWEEVNGEG